MVFTEEFKKEEKLLVPKIESDLSDVESLIPTLSSASVKLELENDFPEVETETNAMAKPSSCTSGDYDEWLEIQKELGVYPPPSEPLKCKNNSLGGSNTVSSASTRPKVERTRANGEYRASAANHASGSSSAVGTSKEAFGPSESGAPVSDRRLSSATELERDLLEDTEKSLDDLALCSQSKCLTSLDVSDESENPMPDDITAQVQSAIDSILNLKNHPANAVPTTSANAASQSSESKDAMLDQAVRSIIGS